MPLAERVRVLTAFKTSDGLLEWLRVPMGVKNAAAYFQKAMVSVSVRNEVLEACLQT